MTKRARTNGIVTRNRSAYIATGRAWQWDRAPGLSA